MTEETIRPEATGSRLQRRVLFALAVLGAMAILAFPSVPAGATTTFTVNETGDAADRNITDARCDTSSDTDKQCTLRAAIEEANDTAGADNIDFDIGSDTGVKTISPASPLPTVTDTVTVDGYTQGGASPNTLTEGNDADLKVRLDGIDAGVDANGLTIEADDSTIKGLAIKRFDEAGVQITGFDSDSNRIEGNFVGVNPDGTNDQGNGHGVFLTSDSNVVGGRQPESRNVISGNDEVGVFISGGTENRVEGNYIGTTADGSDDLGNDEDGVFIFGEDDNAIGGTAAGTRNVISGNGGNGVMVFGNWGTGNRVEGNYVGTTADGNGDLGNDEDGVEIFSSDFAAVGGTPTGAGNRIAHNAENGVSIHASSVGNTVLSNAIYDNGDLGIDLDNDGVTPNDPGDGDTGSNGLQNFPQIRSVTRDPGTGDTTISGKLRSEPSLDYVIQCYLTDAAPALAYGEGSLLLDTTVVSTNADGRAGFTCGSSSPTVGQTVTATATNILSTGDTSEFAKNKAVTAAP